jgi:flotillin
MVLAFTLLADIGLTLGGIAFILFVLGILLLATVQNLVCVSQPNEVIVLSGLKTGKRGYRIVKGDRVTRIPLFEVVDRMDLTNMQIEVAVTGAYSKGGIPLNVQGVANVKISGESPALDNAIQRFLGKPRAKIMQIAKETLEGQLRGVLATLTPEQVNGEKDTFARELQKESEEALHKLGLTLDMLKIQNVSDDAGYLNSTGRKQSADIVKNARIAEAQNKAQSLIQAADNKQKAELARLEAELQIARAESERRTRNAETMQQALVAEQQGQVAALVARSQAELKLQEARVEQQRHKLDAEVLAPSRAQCEADMARAKGEAAKILENGRATAQALHELAVQWRKMGPQARDIFLLQKLDAILPIYLQSIRGIKVDKIAMLQPVGGAGSGAGTASQLVTALETVRAGTGVDLARLVGKWAGSAGASSSLEETPSVPEPDAVDKTAGKVAPLPPAPVAKRVRGPKGSE